MVLPKGSAQKTNPGWLVPSRIIHPATPDTINALHSANRAGDQLVATKLDRLGRSLEHVIELSNEPQRPRGVDLVVLDQRASTPRSGTS